jgi:hypothetical protein
VLYFEPAEFEDVVGDLSAVDEFEVGGHGEVEADVGLYLYGFVAGGEVDRALFAHFEVCGYF